MSLKVHILDVDLDKFKENIVNIHRSKVIASTSIFWVLNAATRERIKKLMEEYARRITVIYFKVTNLENLLELTRAKLKRNCIFCTVTT